MSNKIVVLALTSWLVAQASPEPVFKAMPLFVKNTGTGCGPCGTWGWTQFHDAIETYHDRAVFVSDYCYYYDKDWPYMANGFTDALEKTIQVGGYPTFSVNTTKVDFAGFASAITSQELKNWDVGMQFTAELINSNTAMRVIRYVQAKTPQTGKWELNTFVMEHDYMHTQSMQTGSVAHPYVLRQTYPLIDKANAIFGKTLPAQALNGSVWSDTLVISPLSSEQGQWTKHTVQWLIPKIRLAMVMYKDGQVYNAYTRDSTFQKFPTSGSSSSGVSSSSNVGTSSSSVGVSSSSNTAIQIQKQTLHFQSTNFGLKISRGAWTGAVEVVVRGWDGRMLQKMSFTSEQTSFEVPMHQPGSYLLEIRGVGAQQMHRVVWNP
jgi:hypothetical protein